MTNNMTTDNMSNEEVIETLKGIVFNGFDRTTSKEREALDLAIKVLEERPQDELKEYKPLEPDYNVQCAVENLRTAYWSNDTEKYAKAFTEADQMIVSAICHYGYIVVKGGAENG